jgi:hypothetical protein
MKSSVRKEQGICGMTDERQPLALFDVDDLDNYEERFVYFVVAVLIMGPAYVLLFFLMPLIMGLVILHIMIWVVGWANGIRRRVVRRLGQMMQEILFGA